MNSNELRSITIRSCNCSTSTRHKSTTTRGNKAPTHKAAHSRHFSLCTVLGSGWHNPTLMRRLQMVAGEAWRVRATSRVRARDPALPRPLRHDLIIRYCVMSYSVLIVSATVPISQRCRPSLHRNRHPRRTVAAAAIAAAAVRRLSCCGCGWCLLRLCIKIQMKKWRFCCCVDYRDDLARPSRGGATHLAGLSPPPPPPPPPPLMPLLLLLLCCCLSDGVVLGLPVSVSRLRATAPCQYSKTDVVSPLPACSMEAVYAFSAIRSSHTQPKSCRGEPGLFLAWCKIFFTYFYSNTRQFVDILRGVAQWCTLSPNILTLFIQRMIVAVNKRGNTSL